uniref:zinc ribbon domain-containing protein n=1 Tax=Methanobrevibacter sp. TaxID=66852 RepID=UPI00386F8C66
YATTNIAANTVATGNTFANVAISGTNTTFTDNNVLGTVTVKGNDNSIEDNAIISVGEYAVDLGSTAGNNVTDNILYALELNGDDAVKFSDDTNIVVRNGPYVPDFTVEVENITVGETAVINIKLNDDIDGTVNIIVDGEEYPVDIAGGVGQLNVTDLPASDYTVTAKFPANLKYKDAKNKTVFNVAKKDAGLNITPITDANIGDKVNITVDSETDGALSIKVNGELVTGEYEIAKAGAYTIIVESEATDSYDVGFATYTFEVAEPTEYNITVVVDGKEYNSTVVNGTATVDTDMPDKVKNLTDELNNANAKVDNLTVDLAEAQANATKLADDLAEAQANATKLADDLAEAQANATKLADDLADANAKVDNLTDELANATDKIAELADDLAEAQANATKLADELADANAKVDNLTKELEDALAKIPKSAVVDGKEYPIVYVNGTATVTTEPVKQIGTIIESEYKFTRQANDWDAGERGDFFYAVLKDINGNPLANMSCLVAVNGPIYNVTTDDQGRFGVQVNLARANTYTYALSFLGNDKYSASFNSTKLILTAKKTSITAKAKTFKVKATKSFSVTLKTVKNPYDGKTYLNAGKKITLKINGKTYTAKTNAKGVAKFTIKLTKKGKYAAKIKFAGDKTYKASSKSVKITIK